MTSKGEKAATSYWEELENLNRLCDFLRSSEGVVVREAVEERIEKRVHYMKGEKLVNFLAEPKKKVNWPDKIPKFKSRQEAIDVCKTLSNLGYLHRCQKSSKGRVALLPRNRCEFEEDGYFAWIYEGNKTYSHMLTSLLVIGFLCCVCFPIWPSFLRVFVWYMSVTFLIVIIFLVTIRGFLFLMIWILGYDFWIWPNLFDEHLGFFDSFKPMYSFSKGKSGQLFWRIGIFVGFFSFCYWAVTQPSEFDGFKAAQVDFIKDLYAGKLLSDSSQTDKDNIDKLKMPSLEDLLKMEELDDEDEEDELSEEEQMDQMLESLLEEEEDIDDEEE